MDAVATLADILLVMFLFLYVAMTIRDSSIISTTAENVLLDLDPRVTDAAPHGPSEIDCSDQGEEICTQGNSQ